MFAWRERLIKEVSRILSRRPKRLGGLDLNHGLDHHLSVEALAVLMMQREERPADEEVVRAAALMHDIGYALGPSEQHVTNGVVYAERVLRKVGFPREKIPQVSQVIKHHDDRKLAGGGQTPNITEVLLVKDADTLVVMGALGLIRLAYFTAYLSGPIVPFGALLTGDILERWKLGDSFTGHFYGWYPKLTSHLHLASAKAIAQQRLEFEESFRRQLEHELTELFGEEVTRAIKEIRVG